ncbi:MAG: hypothetical protein ACLSVD_02025 [Eggerthellaceae bacterium]
MEVRLGLDPDTVFKTLVTRARRALRVHDPRSLRADLKKAANVERKSRGDDCASAALTGYVHGAARLSA